MLSLGAAGESDGAYGTDVGASASDGYSHQA